MNITFAKTLDCGCIVCADVKKINYTHIGSMYVLDNHQYHYKCDEDKDINDDMIEFMKRNDNMANKYGYNNWFKTKYKIK